MSRHSKFRVGALSAVAAALLAYFVPIRKPTFRGLPLSPSVRLKATPPQKTIEAGGKGVKEGHEGRSGRFASRAPSCYECHRTL
jgi:hypothetical protein